MHYHHFRILVLMTLSVGLALMISGCATTVQERIVYRTQFITPVVDETLFITKAPERPMDKERYAQLQCAQRESYLAEYTVGLYKDIRQCHSQLNGIRQYLKEWSEEAGRADQSSR